MTRNERTINKFNSMVATMEDDFLFVIKEQAESLMFLSLKHDDIEAAGMRRTQFNTVSAEITKRGLEKNNESVQA